MYPTAVILRRRPGCASTRRLNSMPIFDIDRIIDLVMAELPEVSFVQHEDVWPADDEGVWIFRLLDTEHTIQLESSAGMCPFLVEHDGMPSPVEGGGWTASSVEDAARMVVDYVRAEQLRCHRAAPR